MEWKFYNHAAIPSVPPHRVDAVTKDEVKYAFHLAGGPLLVRWTSDFDCKYETNFWYVVKDTCFDIDELKAKRRYEVNKGIKNFDVRRINPCNYKEDLFEIQLAAFSEYPKKYRPTIDKTSFFHQIDSWNSTIYIWRVL